MIPAYSPQARGRSERSFGTWQGRLPQELRLHGITTLEAANRFLRQHHGMAPERSTVNVDFRPSSTKSRHLSMMSLVIWPTRWSNIGRTFCVRHWAKSNFPNDAVAARASRSPQASRDSVAFPAMTHFNSSMAVVAAAGA